MLLALATEKREAQEQSLDEGTLVLALATDKRKLVLLLVPRSLAQDNSVDGIVQVPLQAGLCRRELGP